MFKLFLQVLVGNREWMRRNGISVPDTVDRFMIDQEDLGQTVVLCAVNGKLGEFNEMYK
jgi:Cu+-exporting ATPase